VNTKQFFAQIDAQNIVTNVAVVTAEFMVENPERYPGTWVETFFDTVGKTYAGLGYIYDNETKDFYESISPPSPPLYEAPIEP
jgi:hypothetical protein